MNSNPTRTLGVSLFAGIFAMFLVYSYSQEKKAEYDKLYGTTKRVVVATKQILEMSTIDDTMVEYKEVPVNFIQPGAVENPEEIIGLVAASPISEGEQILGTKLLAPGPTTGLSNQIAPNKRAVSISVDDVRGVSKLLRPGDRIDILATVESGSSLNRKIEVKTILQDVVVLATGLNVTNNIPRSLELDGVSDEAIYRNLNGDTSFNTITVEVSPKEAQELVLLQVTSPSGLYISLRHASDNFIKKDMLSSTVDSVVGKGSKPYVAPRIPASTRTVKPKPRKRKPRRSGPFVEVQ